jgi:MerR family mercuric resistance operon transcriptional regulator
MPDTMTIGRVAKAAGVNVETIRYYQRRGLVSEPRKPPGGHRRYPLDVLRQIAFIRRAQQLGFTLDEIGQLLALSDGRKCREARTIAGKRHALVASRVAELERMRDELGQLIEACDARTKGSCPLIDALNGD